MDEKVAQAEQIAIAQAKNKIAQLTQRKEAAPQTLIHSQARQILSALLLEIRDIQEKARFEIRQKNLRVLHEKGVTR